MRLVEQWNAVERRLDPRWKDAQLELRVDDETRAERAAALLGPAAPGRSGAKPFLDLLLETPDQQHLAEEIAQLFLRERPSLFQLGHGH